jgi:aminocarboxymuconate-semialdehyde decarboxylase
VRLNGNSKQKTIPGRPEKCWPNVLKMTESKKSPVVDIHSHLYPPSYIELLKSRADIPCLRTFPPNNELRLVNRAGQNGKPFGPRMYDPKSKLKDMDAHGIDISIISMGNPWLDFLGLEERPGEVAKVMNDEMEQICSEAEGRLFFFGALPLTGGVDVVVEEVKRLLSLTHCRGIVMGSRGFGSGLDDPAMRPVYQALAENGLPFFLHPNYGLPAELWGPCCDDYGQVLPVSLGFTMETTIAITRLFLSAIFSTVPELQVVLSHAGGALPFLAGRIENCIEHDRHWLASGRLGSERKTIWDVLRRNVYLDGIVYTGLGIRAAVEAAGMERVMYGTDHPFFPPLDAAAKKRPSMMVVRDAVAEAYGGEREVYGRIMGGNAVSAFNLRG